MDDRRVGGGTTAVTSTPSTVIPFIDFIRMCTIQCQPYMEVDVSRDSAIDQCIEKPAIIVDSILQYIYCKLHCTEEDISIFHSTV